MGIGEFNRNICSQWSCFSPTIFSPSFITFILGSPFLLPQPTCNVEMEPPTAKPHFAKVYTLRIRVPASTGCIWSTFNAPGTRKPLSHPSLKLGEFPFSHYQPLGVIRMGSPGAPQHESDKFDIIKEQNVLNRLYMVQFECPRH